MVFADLIPIPQKVAIGKRSIPTRILHSLVQGVNGSRDLFDEPAVDQLKDSQVCATVRALLPLLGQPFSDAVPAAQFGAGRTEDSVLYLAKANEALEYFIDVLVCMLLALFPLASMLTSRLLLASTRDLPRPGVVAPSHGAVALDGTDFGASVPTVVRVASIDHVQRVTHGNNVVVIVDVILERVPVDAGPVLAVPPIVLLCMCIGIDLSILRRDQAIE